VVKKGDDMIVIIIDAMENIIVFIKHDGYIVIFFSFHPSKLTLSIGYSVTWSNLVNALDIALSEISLAVLRFPD